MDVSDWTGLLAPLIEGRRIILAGDVVAAWTGVVGTVRALGAERVLVYGPQGTGTGPQPDASDAEVVVAVVHASSMMEGIRQGEANLASPPENVLAALDRFDPTGDALVIGSFLSSAPDLCGRPFLAFRRPEWVALEDKTVVDAFWDRAGVRRAPSAVVAATAAALRRAGVALDEGSGTVWSGDSRDGMNGGASYVRWVRSPADAQTASDFFRVHCDVVRVMPFLEGIPCSIHGIVFDDHVAALRPVELVTLRRPDSPEFFYAGCATFYDPAVEDRESMRSLARRVGEVLRHEVSFRGAFTIDGVMTVDGFVPTELNPRQGAGLRPLTSGIPKLPLSLLLDAVVAGIDVDFRPSELETLLVENADACRSGGTWASISTHLEPIDGRPLTRDRDGYRWALPDDTLAGRLDVGPAAAGSFVRFSAELTQHADSIPFAPSAVEFWAFADRAIAAGIGPLQASQPAR